jgi:predicted enzyme related to lactoylglutathione lyase
MRISYQVVAFDAADIETESAFWAGVLGGEIDRDDGWHMVMVDGEPRIGVQHVPHHVAPDWPDGSPPQQVHLDLWVEDFAEAHETVTRLGARVLRPARGASEGDDFQVYADPAGHPFCLCFLVPATDRSDRGLAEEAESSLEPRRHGEQRLAQCEPDGKPQHPPGPDGETGRFA